MLEHLRYSVVEPADFAAEGKAADGDPDLVVIVIDGDEADVPLLIRQAAVFESRPPVLVFGPDKARKWRRAALRAGVFACLSLEAAFEERISLVAAATRYHAAQKEIRMLRRETDIVVQGLLESYGIEAENLRKVRREAQQARESLEAVQMRIIKSML